jgi:hypothetical protein
MSAVLKIKCGVCKSNIFVRPARNFLRFHEDKGKFLILKKLLSANLDNDVNYWAKNELGKLKGVD